MKILRTTLLIFSAILAPISAAAQNLVVTRSEVTALGDLVAVSYDSARRLMSISHVLKSGEVLLDGTLSLNIFSNPPELIGFLPRRGGTIDFIFEVQSDTGIEVAFVRIPESGDISSMSNSNTGGMMRARSIASYDMGIVVAGDLRQRGRTDTAAALTMFLPDTPPRTVLRETLDDDSFIAVQRGLANEVTALGVSVIQGSAGLFVSRFGADLTLLSDLGLQIPVSREREQTIASARFTGGFLLVSLDPEYDDGLHYILHTLDSDGRAVSQQHFEVPTRSQPVELHEFTDGRILVDFHILGAQPAQDAGEYGRYIVVFQGRGEPASIALRQRNTAISEPFFGEGQIFDLIEYDGGTITRTPVHPNQVSFESRWSYADLPEAGIIDIRMLGTPARKFLLTNPRNNRCRLSLRPAPYELEAVQITMGVGLEIIGYSDGTITLFGPGMQLANQQPLERLDLVLPSYQDGPETGARLRHLEQNCRQ